MTRRPSPMGGRKPKTSELAQFAGLQSKALDDVLPDPRSRPLRLLIVGVNPGLWTAAVNAPFARPGNRFWPALHRAGLTESLIDASRGLSEADERALLESGIGITNLVGRATARADELAREELVGGAEKLRAMVSTLRPERVAIAGITAYRVAFAQPKAALGEQDTFALEGWPAQTRLWVVPQPSGLNAHETVDTLAEKWRAVIAS